MSHRTDTPLSRTAQAWDHASATPSARPRRLEPQPRTIHETGLRAPATASQRRLWFIDRMGEGFQAEYHIPLSLRMKGILDVPALASAFQDLLVRHEILRTNFVNVDGILYQHLLAERTLNLTVVETVLTGADRDLEAEELQRAELRAPFDLEHGPLIRVRLLRYTAEDHLLLITMHHIISDGWSMDLVRRELLDRYEVHTTGGDVALTTMPLQYADYAQWHAEWVGHRDRRAQVEYWRLLLAGAPPRLEIPAARSGEPQLDRAGASVLIMLGPSRSSGLRTFARREAMTPFTILYAAWAVLISRISARKDVVIGTPVAGRPRVELEDLIGLFVNTLPLRLEVRLEEPVSHFLKRIRDSIIDALDNQDAPFDEVVEALQPERSIGVNPIFQVMFAYQTDPAPEDRSTDLVVTRYDGVNGSAMFDLLLFLNEGLEDIKGSIDFRTDLFEHGIVECWADAYVNIVDGLISSGDVAVGRIPMLSAAERCCVVNTFNDTDQLFPATLIHRLFEEKAREAPDAVAIVCGEETVTYGELNQRSNRLARFLRTHGLPTGATVGICAGRGIELVIGLLAILKSGAAYVPLDPAYPMERLAYMLDDAAPTIVLTQGLASDVLRAATALSQQPVSVIDLTLDADAWAHFADGDDRSFDQSVDDLAYVIYTSGSTGKPKGIAVEHRSLANLIHWVNRTFEVGPGDTLLFVTSICFDLSVYDVFGILSAGATISIATEDILADPQRLAEMLYSEKITFWDSAPAALQVVIPFLTARPARLRLIFNSGDWIPLKLPQTMREHFPHAQFVSLGGATEATIWSNWYEVAGDDPTWRSIPYGRPIANSRYYILDEFLEPVMRGIPGDLYIGGHCLARGYTSDDLTAERFTPSPFVPHERVYRTGDRARYYADGTIEFLGRSDAQVKIRGFRIELGEIEAQLLRRDDVRDAIVVAREYAPGDRRLVAYYAVGNVAPPSPETLRLHLAKTLPAYMVPNVYVEMRAFPVTANGKLDRGALPAPNAAAHGEGISEPPLDQWETGLAEIWTELLRMHQIGRCDNFFRLGGHSLLAIQLVAKVESRFSVSLPVIAIFRNPSLREMASALRTIAIERHGSSGKPHIIPHHTLSGWLPLGFAQTYRWHGSSVTERQLRQVTRFTRMVGALNLGAFEVSLEEVVERHEALRTRFKVADGVPVQSATTGRSNYLRAHDLRDTSPEGRFRAAVEHIGKLLEERIDLTQDPPIAVTLVRLDDEVHILAVALHLLVADGYSMNVFMRDLFGSYDGMVKGRSAGQDKRVVQMADFAVWQRDTVSMWNQRHGRHWETRLAGCTRLAFPDAEISAGDAGERVGVLAVQIDAKRTAALRRWSQESQTTLVMGVFSLYCAVVMRWCERMDAVVRFQSNGRTDPSLHHSIGVFAAALNLRIAIDAEDSFDELLRTVLDEYLIAVENHDLSYIDSMLPRKPYVSNPTFNWVPGFEKQLSTVEAGRNVGLNTSIETLTLPIGDIPDFQDEPLMMLSDDGDEISGELYFSRNRLSDKEISVFLGGFMSIVDAVGSGNTGRVWDLTTTATAARHRKA
jgi:amino acid adenylation domain-containing protein